MIMLRECSPKETLNMFKKNRHSISLNGKKPQISKSAFIAEGAKLIGSVTIEENASIWYNAVLRADLAGIKIGFGTSIQDCSVIHIDRDGDCIIGKNVIVGHNCILHACTIGDNALIGMGAIVLSKVIIGDGAIIAAGSVVKEKTIVEPQTLYAGSPAKFIKKLGKGTARRLAKGSQTYKDLIKDYK